MTKKDAALFPPSGLEMGGGDGSGGAGIGNAASRNAFEKMEEKGVVVLVRREPRTDSLAVDSVGFVNRQGSLLHDYPCLGFAMSRRS